MDLEDAVRALWKEGLCRIWNGMYCPVVLVNEGKIDQAVEILKKAGFIA